MFFLSVPSLPFFVMITYTSFKKKERERDTPIQHNPTVLIEKKKSSSYYSTLSIR